MNSLPLVPDRFTVSLLAASLALAAEVPVETVRRDVFDTHITDVGRVEDPVLGPRFQLRFRGLSGANYQVLVSSNAQDWASLGSRTVVGGSATLDEPFPIEAQRYYRIAFLVVSNDPPRWTVESPVSASVFDDAGVDLDLHAAEDADGVLAYALYQDGAYRATLAPDELSFLIAGLKPNTEHEFEVRPIDFAGNCGTAQAVKVRTRAAHEPYLNPTAREGTFLSSGEFTVRRTDLVIPGRELGFTFTRTYRSDLRQTGPLGFGWSANIFESLRERRSGDVIWRQGDGRADVFRKQPAGDYASPRGVFLTLRKQAQGFGLIDPAGTVRHFDLAGRLLSVTTRNGNALTFDYAGDRLTSVTDDLGRSTTLAYSGGRLDTLTDFTGRQVKYAYDAAGNLMAVRSPRVTGTFHGNDFPDGKTERYGYDSGSPDAGLAHKLVQIIAPNEVTEGTLTPRETLTYGRSGPEYGRVLTHTLGGKNASGVPAGGTSTYAYTFAPGDPQRVSRTTVTDRRGFVTHHEFSESGHCLRRTELLADRPAVVTTRTYDAEGNVLTVTHPEGNETAYTYDAASPSRRSQGNRLTVTQLPGPRGADPSQRVTRYTYEPVFNRQHTVTDPLGNTTIHRFDFEEGCDFATIGARVGWSATEARSLLEAAGLCLRVAGDLNNDGSTSAVAGNVVRVQHPTTRLFPGGHQATAEGDTQQERIEFFAYNAFGQLIRHADAEQNVTTFTYYAEQDPDGDGVRDNPTGDAATGGYLRRRVEDAQPAPGRNSGANQAVVARRVQFEYNPRGAVRRVTGPRGVVTEVTRNALDQIIGLRRAAAIEEGITPEPAEPAALTPFGYLQSFAYDANDNLVHTEVEDRGDTSDTGGSIGTTRRYDLLDHLLALEEEIHASTTRTTRWRYGPDGHPVVRIQPEGNAVACQYDERGLPVALIRGALTPPPEALIEEPLTFNPRGGAPAIMRLVWSDNGNLIALVDAEDTDGSPDNNGPGGGDQTTCSYDGFDRRTAIVDPAGNRVTYAYDANGNCIRREHFGPDGGPTPTTPAPSDHRLAQTHFHYDEANRLVQVDHWLGAPTRPGADIAEGAVSLGKGNLVPGDGAVNQRFEYDRLGRRTAVAQDDGDTTTYNYDGAGRIVRRTDPAGNQVQFAYDDAGNVIESRRRDVATGGPFPEEYFLTTWMYDALDRPVAVVNNLGHTTRFQYDSRDNLTAVSDANGPAAVGNFTRRAYAEAATTINALNAPGNVTRFTYDGLSRLIRTDRVLTALGLGDGSWNPTPDATQGGGDGLITTRTIYDRNDLVSAQLDDNQFQTSYAYDNANRRITETRGACTVPAVAGYQCEPPTSVHFAYDADHQVRQRTDEAGNVFTYTRDALNRMVQVDITRTPGVGGVTRQRFEYDGLGRLTRALDDQANVTVTRDYDSLSRVVRESTELPGLGTFHTESAWRAEDLRSGLSIPNGTTLGYAYDPADRLARITDSVGAVADYGYLGARLVEERYPNGTRNLRRCDGAARPTQVETRTAGEEIVVGFQYTWDRRGNRLSESRLHDPANSEVYRYDSADQLVRLTRPQPGALPPLHSAWRLDGGGNWREVDGAPRDFTSFNEIRTLQPVVGPPATLTSDANGNLTHDPTAPNGPVTRQFDAFNRLIAVSLAGGPSLTYSYDALGRRVGEEDAGHHRVAFLHDGEREIVDWDADGSQLGTPGTPGPLREFVYGPGSDRPARFRNAAGARFFYHRNSFRSVAALTPETGAGHEWIRYEAYGTPTVAQTGGMAPTGNPLLFTAQRRCYATDDYYSRARYYDPNLGRFLSREANGGWVEAVECAPVPLDVSCSMEYEWTPSPCSLLGNAYAYANNNPINSAGGGLRLRTTSGSGDFDDFIGNYNYFRGVLSDAGPGQLEQVVTGTGGGSTEALRYDLGDMSTHEFGHWLGFASSTGIDLDIPAGRSVAGASRQYPAALGEQAMGSGRLASRVLSSAGSGSFEQVRQWNFTTGEGEVAYQQVYNWLGSDQAPGGFDSLLGFGGTDRIQTATAIEESLWDSLVNTIVDWCDGLSGGTASPGWGSEGALGRNGPINDALGGGNTPPPPPE